MEDINEFKKLLEEKDKRIAELEEKNIMEDKEFEAFHLGMMTFMESMRRQQIRDSYFMLTISVLVFIFVLYVLYLKILEQDLPFVILNCTSLFLMGRAIIKIRKSQKELMERDKEKDEER